MIIEPWSNDRSMFDIRSTSPGLTSAYLKAAARASSPESALCYRGCNDRTPLNNEEASLKMTRIALLAILTATTTAVPLYQGFLAYQTMQPAHQNSGEDGYVVPVRFEVKPEDVSHGVSGFLHHNVSPNVAWYWVRGQKWKWNYIHTALQAAGIPGDWAPYPPSWDESRFGSVPITAVPIVATDGSSAEGVPMGSMITGSSFTINKKK